MRLTHITVFAIIVTAIVMLLRMSQMAIVVIIVMFILFVSIRCRIAILLLCLFTLCLLWSFWRNMFAVRANRFLFFHFLFHNQTGSRLKIGKNLNDKTQDVYRQND